jgi:energy-coupling factor transporter ATP-binding protein EcfA2
MNTPLISEIVVEKLFGMYTYRLPEEGALSNAAILYGDNGVGKSTILRLAFHLLSAAENRGHRNALFDAPFESLEVRLSSGIILSARRSPVEDLELGEDVERSLILSIKQKKKTIVEWDFIPKGRIRESEMYYSHDMQYFRRAKDGTIHLVSRPKDVIGANSKSKQFILGDTKVGEATYLEVLKKVAPTMFILNADRRLDCDLVSDPSDEVEIRKVMRYEEPKRINDLVVRSRQIALSQALSSAGKWISAKAVHSANQGTENVHTVYVNVLKHLVSPANKDAEEKIVDTDDLLRLLVEIEAKTAELAVYELASPLSISELKKPLSDRSRAKRELAAGLLAPYVDSLIGRIDAVNPIYNVLDRFIKIVNGFLSDKEISYKVSQGFSIASTRGQPLDPGHLSSGEQQLLLLFCYVLTGRDRPCVFMIDEPEISLNVKWQRKLVKSLLDITVGSNIQFVFASHSMELLSQHRDRVVRLVNSHG